MNQLFKRLFRLMLEKVVKRYRAQRLILSASNLLNINLLELAHYSIGIMKYQNPEVSGESFFISEILQSWFKENSISKPIIFDVGANKGHYCIDVAAYLPFAEIYAFEPNPRTFKLLQDNVKKQKNIKCFELGFGSAKAQSSIFTYRDELESEHASVYREVFEDFHKSSDVEELEIQIVSLDEFCKGYEIKRIDFLKIDTEGFEFEVLKGSKKLLIENRIDIIQFEFNEMNITSRVYLKDFYSLLNNYSFFRLDSKGLIPLGAYNPMNEIFRFQNIIAVRNDLNLRY